MLPVSLLYAQKGAIPAEAPGPDQTRFYANETQESRGDWKYLRGGCRILTHDEEIDADEIDFNSISNVAYLRGHVRYQNFVKGDKVEALRGEYNLKTQEGTFYSVKGTSPAHGNEVFWLLKTTNPFYFEGQWAERHHDRYIIHNGFLTDCHIPKPWWTLHAPMFDIIPDDRAIAHGAVFKIKSLPLLYLPAFYRPLGRKDRQSGFLTPNFGNSSFLGFMFGEGYYWAINRSYDALYRIQDFTSRGYAHTAEVRGKPTDKSDFDLNLYGVNDRGLVQPTGPPLKEGGLQFELNAVAELGDGWVGRVDYRYLSSYLFLQSFSQSFTEAIFSEVDSVAFVQKHWQNYTVDAAYESQQVYCAVLGNCIPGVVGNQTTVRKLPTVDLVGKDRQIVQGPAPLWYSFDANTSLLSRDEPGLQTGPAVNRETVDPHVMTAFNFKGFSLVPNMTLHVGQWGNSLTNTGALETSSIYQRAADVSIDLTPPSLEHIFPAPKWLGKKIKHVIEPHLNYRYIGGIDNFKNLIRFDSTELLSDTNQVELLVINRFYVKDKTGAVKDVLDWQIGQERYFDPTFGGAVITGQQNVFAVTEDLTPFAFITRPRTYSPIDSLLTLAPFGTSPLGQFGVEWRFDDDPLYGRLVNNMISVTYRVKTNYFAQVGYRELNPDPLIEGYASQIAITVGYGNSLRKGFNVATTAYYDYQRGSLEFLFSQASYNTDCCGFSLQARRFSFGTRNENQFLFSFIIANVGGFGNFRKQDRIF